MRQNHGKLLLLSIFTGASMLACSIEAAPSSAPAPSAASDKDPSSTSTAPSSAPSTTDKPTSTDTSTPSGAKDIVDTAVAAGNFKTLIAAVTESGLEPTLRSAGPFTVFAPTDDAFAKLPAFLVPKLTTDPYKTELGLILKYHVVSSEVKAAALLGTTQAIPSVEGAHLHLDGSNDKVVINETTNVIQADVQASNGVIHAVDSVLLPTIVDTAKGYNDGTTTFTTLVTAIQAAGLTDTLAGDGTFTVFAPTDQAFANLKEQLGDDAFNAILADKDQLTKILTYHVFGSSQFAQDLKAGHNVTLAGQNIKIGLDGESVKIGDSTGTPVNVVLADLPNRNGVIHVIDKVLIPAD